METFSALLALCAGNSPVSVNSPHKGQWRGALMFSLICARINDWVNKRDLRRHRGHYDVNVMNTNVTMHLYILHSANLDITRQKLYMYTYIEITSENDWISQYYGVHTGKSANCALQEIRIPVPTRQTDCLNINVQSYTKYRHSHYKDKKVSWPSYCYNWNLYTWINNLYIENGPWSFKRALRIPSPCTGNKKDAGCQTAPETRSPHTTWWIDIWPNQWWTSGTHDP